MVVGALNSKNRIFHYPECAYASRIKPENLITFDSKNEARACGYRHCIYCSRLLKYYEEDKEEIDKFIRNHHLKMYIDDDSMFIENTFSCWKITTFPDGYGLMLYHGNTEAYDRLKLKDGHIMHHYHIQKYRGKTMITGKLSISIATSLCQNIRRDRRRNIKKLLKPQRRLR